MIGKNIHNLRKDYRLTQVKFAKSIGVSVRSLHRFENEVRLPPIDVIKNIVDTYNISNIYEFMYGVRAIPMVGIPKLMWV